MHRPALGPPPGRLRPPSPGRRRRRSGGSSPAPRPAPAPAPAGCRARRGRRARGRPAAPPRAAGRAAARPRSTPRRPATSRPSARQRPSSSACPRSASPRKIGSGSASATSGRPPSRARCAQMRFCQPRGSRAIRSPRAFSVRAERDMGGRGYRKVMFARPLLPRARPACHAASPGFVEAGGVEAVHPAALRPEVRPQPQPARGVDPPGLDARAPRRRARRPARPACAARKRATCASPSAGSSEQTQ